MTDIKRIINPWIGTENYNCIGCSPDNPFGLHLDFYEEGDDIVTKWKPSQNYSGYVSVLHGGIQALILDELCGWVISRKLQLVGVTSKLEVQYKHSVSTLDPELTARAHIVEKRRNILTLEATLSDSAGKICTTARCLFFVFSKEKSENEMNFKPCLVEGESDNDIQG